MRPVRTLLVVSILILAWGPAAADEPDVQAQQLLAAYRAHLKDSRDISDDEGWIAFKRRLTALRELGMLDCPRSREGLQRVVRTGRHLDDRLLAAQGLAGSADVDAVRALVDILGSKGHPLLTQGAGEVLGRNSAPAVSAWLTKAPVELKSEGALGVVLRAATHASIAPDALLPLFDKYIDRSVSIDLAFDTVHALGSMPGPEATKRVLRAASHADLRLRLAAADVLPQRARDAALDAATRTLLNDDEPLVRYAMLQALGKAKALHFVPEISERLVDENRRTRKTALDVLKQMSGQDFGFDMGAWRRWHESKASGAKPGSHTVPTYHGVPIWSDRLAFILDRSGSMGWPFSRSETTRMAVAKTELQRVLSTLPKGTLFNVLAFDGKVYSWKKGEAVAGDTTIKKAGRWTEKQESVKRANTNTYGVLERTLLQNPRIDTIYLLSDGIPEWGDVISREGLLAAVRHWNRYRRVTINTFAITHMSLNPGRYPRTASMNRAATFMKELAQAGGGSYRFVARVPK